MILRHAAIWVGSFALLACATSIDDAGQPVTDAGGAVNPPKDSGVWHYDSGSNNPYDAGNNNPLDSGSGGDDSSQGDDSSSGQDTGTSPPPPPPPPPPPTDSGVTGLCDMSTTADQNKYNAEYVLFIASGKTPTFCPIGNECAAGECCYNNLVCLTK